MEEPELSAIVLCYRAGESIRRVAEPLYADLEEEGVPFELVLVGNYYEGEDDPTPKVVESLARERAHVKAVVQPKQGGMGWDMRSGFAAARGSYLVVIDGDSQNPVEDVPKAYREMKRTGADLVKGRRIARYDGPYRRLISFVFNAAFRLFFGTRGLWDINGKPKGFTREAYDRMPMRSDGWFMDAEMMITAHRNGLAIRELPVVFYRNDERPSFVRFSAVWEFVANMTGQLLHRR